MKVIMLSSLSYSLINFRGPLLRALVAAGHDVLVCAPDRDAAVEQALAAMNVRFRLTPMARAGLNPLQDMATLASYVRLFREERPETIIAYTQKPIIYGGIAARLYGKARYYALMTGLGHVFSAEADGRHILRSLVSRLYRSAVRNARAIFVFNGDDRRAMIEHGIIGYDHHVVQIGGSGIDVDHFTAQPLPSGPTTFLMIARLMRNKGVGEYVEAARIVKQRHPQVRFQLLGRFEPDNPTGYTREDCLEWTRSGLIEQISETRDVRPHLNDAHVFVLPSYYREGLPRTLLEAISTGRPVMTTDMPGCREPVRPGVNGWLVPPRDATALAEAMMEAIEDPDQLVRMGQASRALALEHYDVSKVNAQLLACMHLDRSGNEPSTPALRATPHRVPAGAVP